MLKGILKHNEYEDLSEYTDEELLNEIIQACDDQMAGWLTAEERGEIERMITEELERRRANDDFERAMKNI